MLKSLISSTTHRFACFKAGRLWKRKRKSVANGLEALLSFPRRFSAGFYAKFRGTLLNLTSIMVHYVPPPSANNTADDTISSVFSPVVSSPRSSSTNASYTYKYLGINRPNNNPEHFVYTFRCRVQNHALYLVLGKAAKE
ncbi:hypothetical protein WG66_006817 [Moniliophthora roreri]|nr:hypothetical protein WG66_006817 [Moniliophthora roreri]